MNLQARGNTCHVDGQVIEYVGAGDVVNVGTSSVKHDRATVVIKRAGVIPIGRCRECAGSRSERTARDGEVRLEMQETISTSKDAGCLPVTIGVNLDARALNNRSIG